MRTRQTERRNTHLLSGSVDRPALEEGDAQHHVVIPPCATISELKQAQGEQDKLTDSIVQAQHRIAMPPIIAYPLVLLAHERGDAEERANPEVVLPAADEHFGVPVNEIALARALLELLVMVWRKVAEQARRLGVPVQGLEVRRLPLTADVHELRDPAAPPDGALTRVASSRAGRVTRRSRRGARRCHPRHSL
jgi:hypothetical protein